MRKPDNMMALRDRALRDLADRHDYYVDTRAVWRIVRSTIQAGRVVKVKNAATDRETTGINLAAKSRGHVARELAEATFQQFHSIFENFILQFLRSWVASNPQSLAKKEISVETLLELANLESAILHVSEKEADRVLRLGPADWFASIEKLVNLGCPTLSEVNQFIEARASRDVLVHNGGVVGKVYTAKAGLLARFGLGKRIQIGETYHRATWELLRKVVADISNAAAAKAA